MIGDHCPPRNTRRLPMISMVTPSTSSLPKCDSYFGDLLNLTGLTMCSLNRLAILYAPVSSVIISISFGTRSAPCKARLVLPVTAQLVFDDSNFSARMAKARRTLVGIIASLLRPPVCPCDRHPVRILICGSIYGNRWRVEDE